MLVIGYSTGALAFGDFQRALSLLDKTSACAVELSALRSQELPNLLAFLETELKALKSRYHYISFHAPTDLIDEYKLIEKLECVSEMGLNIIVHPDIIRDAPAWRSLGSSLCLENLDSRKKTGRTVEELSGFFEYFSEATLCFDIAHARQVDPTMTEAARIIKAFGCRLAQVHWSELNSHGKHFPASYGAKIAYEAFSDLISMAPIIIESVIAEEIINDEIQSVEETLRCHASG